MPDNTNNQSNNQSSNDQNNQSNNSSSAGGQAISGKKIVLGGDGGSKKEDLDKLQQIFEQAGNTVTQTSIGPNQESYMRGQGADLAVYFVNGVAPATWWSFVQSIKSGQNPYTIFAHPGFEPYHNMSETDSPLASMENIRKEPYQPEHDAGQFMNAASSAKMQEDGGGVKTAGEFADAMSQYIGICWGASIEELGQNIVNGTCSGGGGGTTGGNSGGGAQIKDKTFEKCIRRICAATDSIFIVESNAAVLFPYTDWMAFTLRQKINTIKSNDIDPSVFSLESGNDGFYNKVTIAWGGGTLPDRFSTDDEGKQTGRNKYKANYTMQDIYKNMKESNFNYDTWTETQKALAQSKNTESKTTDDKTTQTITENKDGTLLLSEQYDSLVERYGEMEKRVESAAPDFETAQYIINALLIQYVRDYNNMCKCRTLTNRKYIGGTFYAVENPFTKESELFYLNGYTMRTQKNEPIYHDLDFRYGPEGAEEILDYQTLSGGSAASGGTTTTGGSATEQEVWDRAKVPCHFWSCNELRVAESDTQDPKVAEDYYNKMAPTGKKFCLTCYGMSAFLYYEFNYKAGIACQVVGNSGHHVVMIDRGDGKGFVETVQEYRQLDKGFRWSDQGTNVLLPAPSGGSSSSSGNTNSNNSNGGNR